MRPLLAAFALAFTLTPPAIAGSDGVVDPNHGEGGRTGVGFFQSIDVNLRGIARSTTSDKIWMMGQDASDPLAIYIARLLPDGHTDPDFGPGQDGRRRTLIPGALVAQPYRLEIAGALVQTDGKPLIYGRLASHQGSVGVFPGVVCRLAVAGNMDGSFGVGGCAMLRGLLAFDEHCEVSDVAVRTGSELMVAGNCQAHDIPERPFLARLTGNGQQDLEFAAGVGTVQPPLPLPEATGHRFDALAVDADGLSVVLGEFTRAEGGSFSRALGVWRFDGGGSPDSGFSGDGFSEVALAGAANREPRARDLVLRPDGRPLLLGQARQDDGRYTALLLAQLNTDGSADTSFGSGGLVEDPLAQIAETHSALASLELDDLGRILVGGALVEGSPASHGNTGSEFWIGMTYGLIDSPDARVMITGDTATTGVLESIYGNISIPFSVTPGERTLFTLPPGLQVVVANHQVSDNAIHITSADPVAVQVFGGMPYARDSVAELPVKALGTRYRVLAWGAGLGPGSTLAVTASTPGITTVSITPTAMMGGNPPGIPYQVQVGQGQVYRVRADDNDDDVTGTLIVADQPVAVAAGHTCAEVPFGAVNFCEQAVETMQPLQRWGTEFVAVPFLLRTAGDIVRVLADEAGTVLSVNGSILATLDAGEPFDFNLIAAASIHTSKPAAVAQLSKGCEIDLQPVCFGDPTLTLLPPRSQWGLRYLVQAPDDFADAHPLQRFITVVAPASAVGEVRIDGVAIPADQFQSIPASDLVSANISHEDRVSRVTSPVPVHVGVYGQGVGQAYGYPAAHAPAAGYEATSDDLVLRYSADGVRDSRFGAGGAAIIDHGEYYGSPSNDQVVRAIPFRDQVLVGSAADHPESGQQLMMHYALGNADLFRDGFE